MKKQITTIIVICIFIILLITGCNNSINKGYEVEKIDIPILVDGILVEENKYEFSTIVQLKDENILTAAMIEIKLTIEIKLDDITNEYVLDNSKLDFKSSKYYIKKYMKFIQGKIEKKKLINFFFL